MSAPYNEYRGTQLGDEASALWLRTELAAAIAKQATIGALYGILRGESPNLIWVIETVNSVEKADQWALAEYLSTLHAMRDGVTGDFKAYDDTPTLQITLPNAYLMDIQQAPPQSGADSRFTYGLRMVFASSSPPEF